MVRKFSRLQRPAATLRWTAYNQLASSELVLDMGPHTRAANRQWVSRVSNVHSMAIHFVLLETKVHKGVRGPRAKADHAKVRVSAQWRHSLVLSNWNR